MRPRLLALTLICGLGHPAEGADVARRPARLNVMTSDSLFAAVNRNDATAAMRVWVNQVGRRKGFQFHSTVTVFQDVDVAISGLGQKSVDLLVLDTPDYLRLAETGLVVPIAAGANLRFKLGFEYVLLVREGTAGTFGDLREKRVATSSRTKARLGLAWIETLLADQRLGPASQFFSSVVDAPQSSACVLPVFFGRLDACVVDSGNLELLQELNPQLAKLKIVARSPALVEGVVAMPGVPHPYREELIEAILDLHKDPTGAHLVTLFRTGPLVRVTDATFDTVRVIWNRYRKLRPEAGRGSVPGTSARGLEPEERTPR
ncbi:MAG: PhnD/SsuA/transferrin family substrate-binding protein [Bryobacterales bacterium]|nr:PhnD/SsuA/transferrin family substrate-binding protein [Bryobacterales bacterium]